MNFKEIYKSANDGLHGDRDLIDSIIYNSEKHKKPVIRYSYVYACAASAAVVLIAAVLLRMNLPSEQGALKLAKNTGEDTAITESGQYAEDSDDTNRLNKSERKNDTEKAANDENAPQKANGGYNVTEEGKSPSAGEAANLGKNDVGNSSEKNPPISNEFSAVKSESSSVNEHSYSAGGSGGAASADYNKKSQPVQLVVNSLNMPMVRSSVAVTSDESTDCFMLEEAADQYSGEQLMTYAQYSEYCGIDVLKSAVLPSDMNFSENGDICIIKDTQGNITDDTASFKASCEGNEERYIVITVSTTGTDADYRLFDSSLEKSIVNGREAVVTYDGTVYGAYFKSGGTSVSVQAEGITESEIKALLVSLC